MENTGPMLNLLNITPLHIFSGFLVFTSAAIYGVRYLESGISVLRSFWKTIPVAVMSVCAIIFGGPILLTVALILCAVGDYFLSRDDNRFVTGLSAFLTGHIAYIILFVSIGTFEWKWLMLAILFYSVSFGGYLWGVTGNYRWPVLAYIAVITVMAGVALNLPSANFLAVVGAFIFVLSDSVLAVRMFVLNNSPVKSILSWIVWVTYILGQSLIFIGVIGGV